MPNFNLVLLEGHLGRPAEIRTTSNGKPWATFSVAVKEPRKDAEEITHWINCVWWGCYDNAGEWLTKGAAVSIKGQLTTRTYEKNGVKQFVMEVRVDKCSLFDTSHARKRQAPSQGKPDTKADSDWQASDEDVPW